jgi:hypothetical protein
MDKVMAPFLYRCPNTGKTVQGFSAGDVSDDDTYEPVTCIICMQIHHVNPFTGKVLGEEEE